MPSRRGFLKALGVGGAAVGAMAALPPTALAIKQITEPEIIPPQPEPDVPAEPLEFRLDTNPTDHVVGEAGLAPLRSTDRTIIIANGCAVEKINGKFRVLARHDGRLMGPKHIAAMYGEL